MGTSVPSIDEETRRRLRARFGDEIDAWLGQVPAVLAALGDRWNLEFGALIPHGSMSVVVRCATTDGRSAVVKVSPDRERLDREAAALEAWRTDHVPAVLAVDVDAGALLVEAIEPGGMLSGARDYPSTDRIGALLRSLHVDGASSSAFPALTVVVTRLFDSWNRPRQLHPELVELIPGELFERSRRFAVRLAARPSRQVLLHGDLTPVNVLDGGWRRGLVAIDPSPCVGDPAYDAIDLLVWRARDTATIEGRATALAAATGLDATRILDWCVAFAGMFVLDLAGPGQRHADDWRLRCAPLLELASQVSGRTS